MAASSTEAASGQPQGRPQWCPPGLLGRLLAMLGCLKPIRQRGSGAAVTELPPSAPSPSAPAAAYPLTQPYKGYRTHLVAGTHAIV